MSDTVLNMEQTSLILMTILDIGSMIIISINEGNRLQKQLMMYRQNQDQVLDFFVFIVIIPKGTHHRLP